VPYAISLFFGRQAQLVTARQSVKRSPTYIPQRLRSREGEGGKF
jgi:hypothetical protein